MAAVITKTYGGSATGSVQVFYGTITLSVSDTYVTGGFPLNFTQAGLKATRAPIWVDIQGSSGYVYAYVPGTTAANGKIMVRQEGTAGGPAGELPAAAFPAGVAGDTINFRAEFKGML